MAPWRHWSASCAAAALALLSSAACAAAFAPDFGDAACSRSSPCFHVVPHSHMDPGWRATFEEYYPRAASVFEGVVGELCAAPARTFALGDAAFLVTWLRRAGGRDAPARCAPAGATWRQALAALAAEGRLELVGGGWVSPDELLAPPDGILQAFAAGLDALATELPGAPRPAVAWQIDPFGHGAPTPEVLLALNFSAVVLNRVPAGARAGMRAQRALDFRWAAAPGAAALRAHVLHGHYGSPPGLDAAVVKAQRPLVAAEAADRAASRQLLADLRSRARASRNGHALLLVGDDFRYDGNAAAALGSLDALLAAFGDSERGAGAPRLRYSTPSAYLAAAAAAGGPPLPVREGAFAPYSDATPAGENTWAGAYAARPGIKAAAWAAAAAARAGVAAAALAGGGVKAGSADAAKAEELAALLGHHDAVTGTCAAPVAADYRAAAAAARASARAAATSAVARMLRCNAPPAVAPAAASSRLGFARGGSAAVQAEGSSLEEQGIAFTLGVFNPLGWTVEAEAAMPLPPPPTGPGSEDLTLTLRDARTGRALRCQIDPPETAEEEEDADAAAGAPSGATSARPPPAARAGRDGAAPGAEDEAPRRLMLRLIVPDVPPLGSVAVNARWVPRGMVNPRPLWPCEPPRHRHVRPDAPGAAVGVRSAPGASALLVPLRGHGFGGGSGVSLWAHFPPPDGVDEPHAQVRLTLRALRYVFLPDDDAFGAGPYVTRSLLSGGVYLWAGLACGGGAAALAAAALSAAAAARGRRRSGAAVLAPRPRALPATPPSPSTPSGRGIGVGVGASPRRRSALAAAKALLAAIAGGVARGFAHMHPTRRAAGGGAAFAAAAVAVLLQSRALSDDAARAVLTHGFAVGAPLGGAATALVALHRGGGAVASAAFVAGGAVGVPLWLLAAPGWHARLPPRAPAAEAARAAGCAHGAVSSACTVSLGALASATVRASARPLAPLVLTLRARAEDDSEVVARFAGPRAPRVGAGALRDDGAAARAFRFVAGRSVPGNAAPLAGFALLPTFALLPLRPTGGAALGGGAELSVARSVTSDDGRGLGRGAPGRDATTATLRVVLRPAAPAAALRAEQRAALHAPIAVRLPDACAADGAAGSAWPRLTAPLPPDVHVAMLRGPPPGEAPDAPLRLTLQHLGEPGADGPHALASLAAALGGAAEALHSEGVYAALRPGGLAQLRWRPAWEEAPRVAPAPPRGAQNCLRLPPGEPCVDNDGLF